MTLSLIDAGWALLKLGRFEEGANRLLSAAPAAAKQKDWTYAAGAYRLAAFCRSRVGDHQGAIDALASASQLLSEHPVEFELATLEQEEAPYTGRRAALIAGTGQETISDVSLSVDEIISAAAQKLGSGDVAAKVLASWISGFVEQTLGVETAPAKLEALARSIAVSLPDRFGAERDRLTAAAAYHAAGRSSAALERLDPDFARALAQMHPPAETRAVSRSTRRKS